MSLSINVLEAVWRAVTFETVHIRPPEMEINVSYNHREKPSQGGKAKPSLLGCVSSAAAVASQCCLATAHHGKLQHAASPWKTEITSCWNIPFKTCPNTYVAAQQ